MTDTRSPRFAQWLASLIFSTICLGSVVEVDKNSSSADSTTAKEWAVASSAMKFVITFIVVCMHMNPISSIIIVGTKIEGAIIVILVALWISTVAVVTDSRHGIAVDEFGAVENGNLYYFSWAGFMTSIMLLAYYLQQAFGLDVAGGIRNRSARMTTWSALLSTSLVVMGSSGNYYDTTCGGVGQEVKCDRAVFGIILGAMSSLISVGIVGMKIATRKAPFLLEAGASLLLVVLYGFGVAILTSQNGPGSALGNLYYFTWASFLESFLLLTSCFEDYSAAAAASAQDTTTTSDNNNNG
eukprot:CAMPEP_0176498420 /NCGR_PEP_ID=MMETSP0200_2-20121128/12308_1 /TAXON_ID=947934 /ORGANISM="Chaetoceros sp., Strain GSL56" /LENGTH=297 /DNA_ID=CAMNT_0017896619 /DNA_START=101 /DNA_END=991 /DNA_ORIENTATION=-